MSSKLCQLPHAAKSIFFSFSPCLQPENFNVNMVDIKWDPDSCFLCQSQVSSKDNICKDCDNGIKFCSQDHLNVHRGIQKTRQKASDDRETVRCWPFRIGHDEVIGNLMVASRDIKAGETILEEPPAVWGPNNKSLPVCLECLKPVKVDKVSHVDADGNQVEETMVSSFCSKCNYPICDADCKYQILPVYVDDAAPFFFFFTYHSSSLIFTTLRTPWPLNHKSAFLKQNAKQFGN